MLKQLLIGALVVALATAAAFVIGFGPGDDATDTGDPAKASIVNVVNPAPYRISDRVSAVGTLQAQDAVTVTSEISGRVVARPFGEGNQVDEGELLVRLDDRQARADLQVAEARLEDAERQYNRARELINRQSVSQSRVDELRTARNVARAEKIAAETRLDNHRIEAPFSGVIGLSDVSVGTYLTAGDTITTLDAVDTLELRFSIPERYIGQVREGQAVAAMTIAWPGRIFNGAITELGTRIQDRNRSLPVTAAVANPERLLRPGQFMSVQLTLGRRDSLVIPEQAVLTRGDDQFVYVAEDGQARRRTLALGSREPGLVEVRDGLSAEDQLIITRQDRLSSGDPVEPERDPTALVDTVWPPLAED
ncbi:MAG: efflux RND transporter periplasmic adaptor subunit [Pseudomonadota bacterium]